jgi:serine-type D-Ala-D-Ala carboxypeptidase (penicillin-binding protein 5/6)
VKESLKIGLVLTILLAVFTQSEAVFANAPPVLKIDSHAAILMEPSSGEVLFRQNQDKKMPPASVTKMMVMLLTLEALEQGRIKLTDTISASPEACKMGGSQIWLEPGEQMTVTELLKAVCIVSANDASYALAEHIAGSEENFIAMMNKRAGELGLKNTHYVNTTGLEPSAGGQGNITSAEDMALLAREVIKYPKVFQWTGVWIDSLRGGKSFLRNTNNLVRFYSGCDGLKTGFTSQAGFCLVATAKREGVRLIAVVMKAADLKMRSRDIAKLFNYGFSKFKAHKVFKGGEQVGTVKVFRGKQPVVAAVVAGELTAVLKRDFKGSITKTIQIKPVIHAPVQSGQKIGQIVLTVAGKKCGQADLVAAKTVERATFFQIWRQIIQSEIGNIAR